MVIPTKEQDMALYQIRQLASSRFGLNPETTLLEIQKILEGIEVRTLAEPEERFMYVAPKALDGLRRYKAFEDVPNPKLTIPILNRKAGAFFSPDVRLDPTPQFVARDFIKTQICIDAWEEI
jgi:hypothetical protein